MDCGCMWKGKKQVSSWFAGNTVPKQSDSSREHVFWSFSFFKLSDFLLLMKGVTSGISLLCGWCRLSFTGESISKEPFMRNFQQIRNNCVLNTLCKALNLQWKANGLCLKAIYQLGPCMSQVLVLSWPYTREILHCYFFVPAWFLWEKEPQYVDQKAAPVSLPQGWGTSVLALHSTHRLVKLVVLHWSKGMTGM